MRHLLCCLLVACLVPSANAAEKVFQAGVFAMDVTPVELPVIINGNMTEVMADKVNDPLHARCFVLDDGQVRIALAVVDSCMIPRNLLDEAKAMAEKATGIPSSRIMISSTHTHSAPSSHACLGSDADPKYIKFLPGQIAKGISEANKRLQPVRIGWGMGRDEKNVACRHWVMKPGIAPTNRFGGTKNDLVMMHPGHNNPNAIRATGTPDPEVPVIALQTLDGKPLGLFSAYSLHYVGAPAISADYFAMFCDNMTKHLVNDKNSQEKVPFLAALANATSGDNWLMDYTQKERRMYSRDQVAEEVAAAAKAAYDKIQFFDWVPLVMKEELLSCKVRMPSAEEVKEAEEFSKSFEGRKPKTLEEIYARETLLLSKMPPTRELKLQAIRLGDLGIATIPNEVISSTGLQVKKDSPLKTTFVLELANGCEGYLLTPELISMGGYTAWRARTACLEGESEPAIRATLQKMLSAAASERAGESAIASTSPQK